MSAPGRGVRLAFSLPRKPRVSMSSRAQRLSGPQQHFPEAVYWQGLPEGHFRSRAWRQQRDALGGVLPWAGGGGGQGGEGQAGLGAGTSGAEMLSAVRPGGWPVCLPRWSPMGSKQEVASRRLLCLPPFAGLTLPSGSLAEGGAGGGRSCHQEAGVWEFGVTCVLPAVQPTHSPSAL